MVVWPSNGARLRPQSPGRDRRPGAELHLWGEGVVSRRCQSRAPCLPSHSVWTRDPGIWTRDPGGPASQHARHLLPASGDRVVSSPSFCLFLVSSFPPSLSSSSFCFFSPHLFIHSPTCVNGLPRARPPVGRQAAKFRSAQIICALVQCAHRPSRRPMTRTLPALYRQAPGAALSSTSHLACQSPMRQVRLLLAAHG